MESLESRDGVRSEAKKGGRKVPSEIHHVEVDPELASELLSQDRNHTRVQDHPFDGEVLKKRKEGSFYTTQLVVLVQIESLNDCMIQPNTSSIANLLLIVITIITAMNTCTGLYIQ